MAEFIYSNKIMITIRIKDWEWNNIYTTSTFFSLQITDEVNKGWSLKFSIPTDKRLRNNPIAKWNRVIVFFTKDINNNVCIFSWYICDISITTNKIDIEADNWLTYLQNRILREEKNYDNATIMSVVSECFSSINSNFALPITLGTNNSLTRIKRQFNVGTSLYDIFKFCCESDNDLLVRILPDTNQLQIWHDIGTLLDWAWEYNVQDTRATKIIDWSWKDTTDEFYTYILTWNWSAVNSDWNTQNNLILEKFEQDWALNCPTWNSIPSITIDRDTDWWEFYVWDRKTIRLYTEYSWFSMEYTGIIQSRKITVNSSGLKAEVKVSEEYQSDKNILDIILSNLRK